MARIQMNFMSYSLGYPTNIDLILPTLTVGDCDPDRNPTHVIQDKYPVLYLLHGHANDSGGWLTYTSVSRYAEEHRIAVCIVSTANVCYMNAPAYGENYYDLIHKEIPELITANFPISQRPEDTYICGYSMGGYGAMLHAFLDPGKYAAAGLFSPGAHISSIGQLHGIPEVIEPEVLIDNITPDNAPALFVCVGKEDFLYEDVIWLHQALDKAGIAHRFDDIANYKHEFAFWDMELLEFIKWLPRTDAYAKMDLRVV